MKLRSLQRGLSRLAGRYDRQKTYDPPEVRRRHEAPERFRELNQAMASHRTVQVDGGSGPAGRTPTIGSAA